jgi:hypothetical protein
MAFRRTCRSQTVNEARATRTSDRRVFGRNVSVGASGIVATLMQADVKIAHENLHIFRLKMFGSISKIVFLVAPTTLLAACAFMQPTHYVDTLTPDYDPTVSARVRILSANGPGRSALFWPGSCYRPWSDTTGVRVSDGFLASWKYSSRSVVIGMPPSPRAWMRSDGLVHKDLIREYVVPAGKPITFALAMSSDGGKYGGTTGCAPPAVTFTPSAGWDYDVFLDSGHRRCWASVRHIDGLGMDDPVALERAPKCQADAAAVQIPAQ